MLAERHALARPSVEVGLQDRMKSAFISHTLHTVSTDLHVDATSSALILADRPVLLKGLGAIDRWLVGTGALRDLVRAAVARHGTLVLGVGGWVVGAEVLDHVVLNQAKNSDMISGCPRQGGIAQKVVCFSEIR
jgi:hypothetical protein